MIQKFTHHKNGFVSFRFNWQGQTRVMFGLCIFGRGIGYSKTNVIRVTNNTPRQTMTGAQADW